MQSGSRGGASQGCVVALTWYSLSALVLGGYAFVSLSHVHPEAAMAGALMAGLGGGLFLTIGIGAATEIVRRVRELRRVTDSTTGAPLADGTRIAASGTLAADGPVVPAPMSGLPSAIYHYEVTASHRNSTSSVCQGYALTPCHIETAAGNVRVLGYTEMAFPGEVLAGDEIRARLERYLVATTVTPLGLDALHEFNASLEDDDGAIKWDSGGRVNFGSSRLAFVEHRVGDREQVCAFGKYSAERGGLVPDPSSSDPYPVRIRRGDAAAVRRALVLSAFGYAAGAALTGALAVGVTWTALVVFGG